MPRSPARKAAPTPDLAERLRLVRARTLALAAPLSDADAAVQSAPFTRPAKWHLAATTAYFETAVLKPFAPAYRPLDERLAALFDPFGESAAPRLVRAVPGLLTRPSLDAVRDWRRHVDGGLAALLAGALPPGAEEAIELGLEREARAGECLLADVLHLFAQNPMKPNYREPEPRRLESVSVDVPLWIGFPGGLAEIGAAGPGFDVERPRHQVLLRSFELADRPVTNGEFMEFVEDGGYRTPPLWLADGWETILREKWSHPPYWEKRDGIWWTMTLRGLLPVDVDAPVAHLSWFEADAFARWAGRRLPSEAEWEHAAAELAVSGNLLEREALRPMRAAAGGPGLRQMFGDVWEWTTSPFGPYPGFPPEAGTRPGSEARLSAGRFVARGGSALTPAACLRATTRLGLEPAWRHRMTGLRLARDG